MAIVAPAVAAQRYDHATYARYQLAKCRCFPCRLAHADYVRELSQEKRLPYGLSYARASKMFHVRHIETGTIFLRTKHRDAAVRRRDQLNGPHLAHADRRMVSVARTLRHIEKLHAVGLGSITIAERAGVNRDTILKITSGKVTRIRQGTANAILGVGYGVARGACIDAAPTWRLIDEILATGKSKAWIARELGSTAKQPSLEIHRHACTRATAEKVAALHARIFADTLAPKSRLSDRDPAHKARWEALRF